MSTQQLPCLLVRVSYQLGVLLCLFFVSVNTSVAETAVGKATLVIGTAYVEKLGVRQRLHSGDAIFDGREIMTTDNGYVHIRFNDQGLISVRHNSRLVIEKYDYNPLNPKQSTVKFSLKSGSARSVSGKAAQSAKQRFRLNTPLAAIGVRGTDFVVRADQKNVQAIVNEGAIVVAPFSSQCSVDDIGPCAANAVTLSSDSKKLLQFNGLLDFPQLIPISDKLFQNQLRDAKSRNNITMLNDNDSYVVYTESQASQPLALSNQYTYIKDVTPVETIAASELANKQLLWGHWGVLNPADKIAIPSIEVADDRKITIANSRYGLFREGESEVIASGLGAVSFDLSSAQVDFVNSESRSAMVVGDGHLDIDFNYRNFTTGLSLFHTQTGQVNFSATGSIDRYTGFFNDRRQHQRLGGAVSLDGTEAGYFFSQDIDGGNIEGLTLWGQQ